MKKSILADPEKRCRCGHLLALLSEEGIEIKCRRCKRLERIDLAFLAQFLKDKGLLSPDPSCNNKEVE